MLVKSLIYKGFSGELDGVKSGVECVRCNKLPFF